MRVGEIMSAPAITASPGLPVAQVARQMLDHQLRAIPVVDPSGKLLGMVSESDLLVRNAKLHFPSYLGILESVLPIGGDANIEDELHKVLAVSAAEVMSTDIRHAHASDDLGETVHTMLQHHLPAIPVVDDQARLEGMLFPPDVIRLIARETPA